jgi:hypothetical protein
MWLLAENCGRIFHPPPHQAIESDYVIVGCPDCKRVDKYTLRQTSPDYNPADSVVGAPLHVLTTDFLAVLECEAGNCEFQSPVVALWNSSMTAEERQADLATWKWEGLTCSSGHPIPKPYD